jgi:antitoxin component of MazEF toxin-antitoxin module
MATPTPTPRTRAISSGHLQRWGNSRAVRITQALIQAAGIDPEQAFDVLARPGEITFRFRPRRRPQAKKKPASPYRRHTLDDLLAERRGIPARDIAGADAPRGRERP